MDPAQRIGQRDETELAAQRFGKRLLDAGGVQLGDAVGERSERALLVPLKSRIDRHDSVEVNGRRCAVVDGLDFGVRHLPADPGGADLSGENDLLAEREPLLEPRTALEVRRGDAPGRVSDHRFEVAAAVSYRDFSGSFHRAEHHPAFAGPKLRYSLNLTPVLVAARKQKKDVARAEQPLPLQGANEPGVEAPPDFLQRFGQWPGSWGDGEDSRPRRCLRLRDRMLRGAKLARDRAR